MIHEMFEYGEKFTIEIYRLYGIHFTVRRY